MHFVPVDSCRNILGEGPFWDEETQRLYLVDINGRLVLSYDADGNELDVWTMPDVVSTAIPRRKGGLLVTLRDGAYLFDPQAGTFDRLASTDPDPENRINESRVDPEGRLWCGTMKSNVGRNGEALPIDRATGTLSVVEADGTWRQVLSGIGIPNTLCWSPEGDRLYFADTMAGEIYRFRYDPKTGAISDKQVFSDVKGHGFPDGSALDEHGFLWNARWQGGCIIRFSPDGRIDRIVELPVRQPTSCVFGGPQRKTLFVTSANEGLSGLTADSLDGATLVATADVRGERCTRFAG